MVEVGEFGVWTIVKGLILGLILLVLLGSIIGVIRGILIHQGEATACITSIRQNAALHFDLITFSTEIKCPTKEVIIKEDIEKKEAKVKEAIAKEMLECWYTYGGPDRLTLFEDKTGKNVFCSFCSLIRFKDKAKEIKGMNAYLLTHPLAKNESYWNQLYPFMSAEKLLGGEAKLLSGISFTIAGAAASIDDLRNHLIARDLEIDTDKDLAIVFLQGKVASAGLQRLGRGIVGLETVTANSAVLYVPFDKENIEELECTSFPVEQLKYVEFPEDEK